MFVTLQQPTETTHRKKKNVVRAIKKSDSSKNNENSRSSRVRERKRGRKKTDPFIHTMLDLCAYKSFVSVLLFFRCDSYKPL